MSYKYIFLSALFCCGFAHDDSSDAKILNYHLEREGPAQYFFRFESSDGIVREEEGNLLDENAPDSPVIVKGSYSYTDETGKVYTVRYIADENGFHPEGEHIQVPTYVVNPSPPIVIASTPRPPAPIQLVQNTPRPQFIQTTPRPQFLPSEPARFQLNAFQTTTRPEVVPAPTRIQVPVESKRESKVVPFNQLDGKLQSSIVNLLSSGDARGFNVAAVNSV